MRSSEEIITRVCGNIESRIQACRSRKVALRLKNYICAELEDQCKSEIINNMLSFQVDKLIEDTFDDATGLNKKLLEE